MPRKTSKNAAKSTKRSDTVDFLEPIRDVSPLELVEREREFLSEELHDTVSQSLSGLSILVSFLHSRLEKGQVITQRQIKELQTEIYKASDELKILSFTLKPQNLEGGGLILALSELVDFTTQFRPCEFECNKPVFVSSHDRGFAFFRIAQEALRCAALVQSRHNIKLRLLQVDGEVIMEVSPFPGGRSGKKYTPKLIELYCKHIGAAAEFKTKTETLRCKAKNI
ncbi:MAG: sensor histidine kinase [Verrucomicrobiales bacterium]